MTNCTLAATGTDIRTLVLLAVLLVGTGLTLLLAFRRGAIGRGAAIIVALAVGVTALSAVDTSRAAADVACPPGTGVASASIGAAPTTTIAPPTSVTSTTQPTTTTTSSTTSTTTTLPVADLTPTISGPAIFGPGSAEYVVTVSNLGPGSTVGAMTFTVNVNLITGPPPVTLQNPISPDWTVTGAGSHALTFTSTTLVLDAGDVSTVQFTLDYSNENPASMLLAVTLPSGIGGETNNANNTASLTAMVPPPPG